MLKHSMYKGESKMRHITVDELRHLVGCSEPCLSIYAPLTGDREHDVGVVQPLLDQALERSRFVFPMVAKSFGPMSAAQILDAIPTERPWKGVGIFKSLNQAGFHPLESATESFVIVSDSFHLRPLFGKLQMNSGYIAIRLERERVQIFRGSTDGVKFARQFLAPRRVPGFIPDEITKAPISGTSESRYSNAARRIAQMKLDRATIRFYRETDKELRRALVREATPVILVGEERLIGLYKSVNRHRSALIGNISTDDGALPLIGDVHQKALGLLEEIHRRQALFGAVEYRYTRNKGRAIDNLSRIADAAAKGQIKSLLIRAGTNIWGRLSRKSGRVQLEKSGPNHLGDDVLDDIGEMVLKNKGQVFILNANEMPTAEPAAAVLVPQAAV